MARNHSALNDLQSKLVDARNWSNQGRWQSDAPETIIFYRIVREHLFGESETRLFKSMSRFGVTWSMILGDDGTALDRMHGEVVKMIETLDELKTVVEADSELAEIGWRIRR